MSAVSLHNLMNNINEVTRSYDMINLNTMDTNWSLNDPDLALLFPHCNGLRQSPIELETNRIKTNKNLRLGLTAYDKPISGFLVNSFPTFNLVPDGYRFPRPNAVVSNSLARSFNPYADSHFVLNHIEFHWSQSDQINMPAIHKLDGVSNPLEIHFIHLNTAYSSINEAFNKSDGLLAFAVMAVASTHESYVFDRILNELSNITKHSQQVAMIEDSTWRSLLPADTSRFYRYQGSMILPPCYESVQWVIFKDQLKLGYKQLKRLQRFRFIGKDMRNNREINWSSHRRPLQPINSRFVEQSFSNSDQ